MYFRQIFTNEKIGLVYLIILGAVYNLSIVTLTVGFFTPYWLHGLDYYWGYGYYDDNNGTWGYWNHDVNIDTAGLISGEFRYPYSRKFDPSDIYGAYTYYVWQEDDNRRNIANDTKRTFYLTVTTMCILYSNLIMALAAFIFKLSDNRIYMSLLSLSFGTLYPLGAISILIATIALELEYKSEVGFSTVLGTVSGGFMLLFYSGLRFYNYQYIKHLIQIEKENTSESIGKASWGKEKAQAGVDAHADYNAVRAMLFLAIFSVVGAFVCVIIKLLVKKDNKLLMYAAAACLGFAGICLMIGFAVYHAEIFNPEKILLPDASLHAGFALCIVSWLLSFALAGAILFLVLREGE